MRTTLFVIACFAFAGCVSEPTKVGDHSVYQLEKEISWSASTPLGERTIKLPAGVYVAIFEDSEGVYLSSPTGKILTGKDGKEKWAGGVYLPFDHTKGINIFQGGGGSYAIQVPTAVGLVPVMVPDKYFRMKLWGPSDLISLFKKANDPAKQRPEHNAGATSPSTATPPLGEAHP